MAALNPQLATLARSQLASKIEIETVRWMGERVGWPGAFNGTFTCHLEALQEALAQAAQKLHAEGRCDQKRAVPL